VLLPDGSSVTNTFRFDGLRYSKQEPQATTKFLWDVNNYLAETDAADEIQAVYTNEPQQYGNLISQYRKGPTLWLPSYYHYDALGSARALTDGFSANHRHLPLRRLGQRHCQHRFNHNPFRWVGQVGYYWDEGLGTFYILHSRMRGCTRAGEFAKWSPNGYMYGCRNRSRPWPFGFCWAGDAPASVEPPISLTIHDAVIPAPEYLAVLHGWKQVGTKTLAKLRRQPFQRQLAMPVQTNTTGFCKATSGVRQTESSFRSTLNPYRQNAIRFRILAGFRGALVLFFP
jgi:hypothetical protein